MEIESGHGDSSATGEFHRVTVSGPMKLKEGERRSIPFQLVLPWETPVTAVSGQSLHGMVMGVRTEVATAKTVDQGDLDLISIEPLPVQQRILDAFAQLGFVFKGADLEYGQIYGVQQTLPFYQEIEYFPAPQYAHSVSEVELTFVANPHGVEVILEFDKRGGMFSGGHDSYGRYSVRRRRRRRRGLGPAGRQLGTPSCRTPSGDAGLWHPPTARLRRPARLWRSAGSRRSARSRRAPRIFGPRQSWRARPRSWHGRCRGGRSGWRGGRIRRR